ncbi:unnamed protein product [Allacma fusca]|uniref:Uncharacterized protein n=1 Tax=Allacma fusca TaxID=39272 RepID=A0A8J2L2V9_9HEXA|nr:unnamed protein product [Allacma fusca]
MLGILFPLYCLISTLSPAWGATVDRNYKPSISELSVPFRDNPKILLANFPGNAVVLALLNGEVSASNYMVHLARQAGNSDPGHFIVEAPKDYGVMAVIQQLHLRRISDSKSLLQLVNNCKDYIMFEGYKGEKTIPICGTVGKRDDSFYPPDLHGPKFFNSPNGSIKVTFRNHYDYGNELIAPNEAFNQSNQEILTVHVAFTAYSKCVTPEETSRKFKCTIEKCIDRSLECDEIVNCTPGENQRHFGIDEKNCSVPLPPLFHPSFAPGHKFNHRTTTDFPDSIEVTDGSVKPPHMTTIIILVILLTFITVCGYFWSWLSHVFCIMRSMFRSAEVGVEVENPQVFASTAPRLQVAHYVPAVVLRTNLHQPHEPSNNKTELESPPPSYDILFPKSKE